MTTELQEKAKWVSEIYAAVAKGDTLQIWHSDTEEWRDATNGPNLTCREDWWRIKPNPQTFWIQRDSLGSVLHATNSEGIAEEWRKEGYCVTETVEVLP